MRSPSTQRWHPKPKHLELMADIDAMEVLDQPLRTNAISIHDIRKFITYWLPDTTKVFKNFTFKGYVYIIRVQ